MPGVLNQFGRNEEAFPVGRFEVFDDGDVGEIPSQGEEFAGGFLEGGGDGVGFFGRLGAGVAVDFDITGAAKFVTELDDADS